MRPAHTRGSAHRVDLLVRRLQMVRWQVVQRARVVGPAPRRGADGGRCSDRRTRPAQPAAAGTRRSATGQAAHAERCRPTAPRRHSPAAPAPACAAPRFPRHQRPRRTQRELCVPIADQKPEPADAIVEAHDQVAGLLGHPRSHWMRSGPEHVDPARGDLDHEQHVQPFEEHGVHGEEVHRQHTMGLGPEEPPPGQSRPLRGPRLVTLPSVVVPMPLGGWCSSTGRGTRAAPAAPLPAPGRAP
jgi:hypothetical protein